MAECTRKLYQKFPWITVPSITNFCKLINVFKTNGSLRDNKIARKAD
jgi:hypothetical protein